ncbi:hypothetical protein HDU79_009641 [Rhizoclosmatium sp. JEL0117]|nr:hypothetical protein HDU79_009641 [Rhizoclosmatium sp. JEL0117]
MSLASLPTFEDSVAGVKLSPSDLVMLEAILDAIIPAVPSAELGTHQDQTSVELYARTTPSDLHAVKALVPLLAVHKPPQLQKKVKLVLWLLTTGPGTLVLMGFNRPFLSLTQKEREQGMLRFCNSAFNDLRLFFKDFKAVAAINMYGRSLKIDGLSDSVHNPTWAAMGYPGMTPQEKPVPKNFDHVWQPTFMDIESQVQGNDKTVRLTADVVVVGSGAGGGVVAAELAKAGLKVIVIEKSKHRRFEDYSNNEMDSLFNNMEGNGLLQSDDAAISILAGSAFGGGTAINWACSLRTPDKVREEWATKYHLPHFASQAFTDSLDTVCERNGVTDKNVSQNVSNQILLDGCKKLGYHAAALPQNAAGKDHRCAFCNMGCPYAEKQGTHVTWLKDAAECGTQFIQQCKVEKVTYEKGKVTGIVGTMFTSGVKLVIQSTTVVSSCGSMNSPLLLARSGLKNQHIGRNLKLHPVSFVQGYFPDRAVNPFEGGIMTSISDIVTDREGTGYGARIEVPSMHPGVFAAIGPYRGAAAFKKMMLQYKNRVSLMALCRDYDSTARVYQDAQGYTHIDFSLGSFDSVSLEKAIVAKMKILLAAGATEVDAGLPGLEPLVFSEDEVSQGNTVNSAKAQQYYKRIHEIGVVGQKAKLGSAHQMGTCRMGHNPSAGVVSPHGETWEVKGLYVADASVFPTPSGVNPMVTVLAVAHSIAQFIKSDLGVSSKL